MRFAMKGRTKKEREIGTMQFARALYHIKGAHRIEKRKNN